VPYGGRVIGARGAPAAIVIEFRIFKPAARVAICGISLSFATESYAQQSSPSWPTRPVRLVVPFPAGGFSDVLVRVMTPGLAERLGQPLVVDNKPGASGEAVVTFPNMPAAVPHVRAGKLRALAVTSARRSRRVRR
jgi:tripartite-type tricarboxylate transporter receptor subunit TctC